MLNPRYANDLGWIIAVNAAGVEQCIEPGQPLHAAMLAGTYGEIAPYVQTPEPTAEEIAAGALALARARKHEELAAARDAACYVDVTALDHTWQADPRSQELLANAIRRGHAGKPLPPVWRSADNVDMPVETLADLEAIEDAIAAQTLAAYQQSWVLKAQLDAATTPEEVEAIQWT